MSRPLAMNEDDLLIAIGDALHLFGYVWHHDRRGDLALTMGTPGTPDIIAARAGIVWFIELKGPRGRLDLDQWTWARAIGQPGAPAAAVREGPFDTGRVRYRLYWPEDLDRALSELK